MVERPWPLAVALVLAGCCDPAVMRSAQARADALRAAIVDDLAPEVPAPDSCADAPLVTFPQVRGGAREGELIALDGVPLPGSLLACTEMLCTDGCGDPTPCCNECSSDLSLVDHIPRIADGILVTLRGPGLWCSGYDCARQCRPFGNHPRQLYRFVGRYQRVAGRHGTAIVAFDAERWCHAPSDGA